MKLRNGLIAILLGVSILGCGCGNNTSENTPDNTENSEVEVVIDSEQSKLEVITPSAYGNVDGLSLEPGTSISVIGRGSKTAYWNAVEAGAKKAVKDMNEKLGYEGENKIKVVYSAPETEGDVDEQVNILDEELARYPGAIGIAAVDMYACEVQFDLAIENNIPIVAYDAGSDYQNILALVKTDDQDAAKMAANKLADMIGDHGQVLIIAHDTNSMTAQDRENAFAQQMKKKHEGIEIVETYHLDEREERARDLLAGEENAEELKDTVTHADIVRGILEHNPEVKAIYATSESASIVVQDTLEAMNLEGIKVVSFDGGEAQLERLKAGKISGLIVQNPFGMGYATVVAASRAILGQGNEAIVDTGYTWVTAENLEDVRIQNMMY